MSPKAKTDSDQQVGKNKMIGFVLLIVLVIGFLFLYANQGGNQVATAEVITLSASTDTPTPSPIASDNTNATPMCFWNWATNDASPEHIDALKEALDSAGFTDYELLASAYGEDQICQRGDEIVSSTFHMMDISPTISLSVDNETLADSTALGAQVRQIVTALQAQETLPKINRVEINFTDETDSARWIASYSEVTQAIADNMNDDDLYALGQG